MNLELRITTEQMEKVFTQHGFKIVVLKQDEYTPIHGSRFTKQEFAHTFVQNPMNMALVPLKQAFSQLMNNYAQKVIFSITKFEVIQSLTK